MISFNRSCDITLGMAGLPEAGWYEPRVASEAEGCRVRREPERGAELRGKVIGGAAVGLVRIGRGGQRSVPHSLMLLALLSSCSEDGGH